MQTIRITRKPEKKEYYAVSPAQKRIYLLQQLHPDSVAWHHLEMMSDYTGDHKEAEDIINYMISRYEIFRTRFRIIQGELVQVIHPEEKINIGYYTPEDQSVDAIYEQMARPFDWNEGPLIRVSHVHRGERLPPLLFFQFHHILFDLTSVHFFFKTFHDIRQGIPLQDEEFNYKDYSEWLSRAKGLVADRLPLPVSPAESGAFGGNGSSSAKGKMSEYIIDMNGMASLAALAEGFETTLFTVLFSCFTIALKRLDREEEMTVGLVFSGRDYVDPDILFGTFVDIIPVRSVPDAHWGYLHYLKSLKESIGQYLENGHFPSGPAASPAIAFMMLDQRTSRMVEAPVTGMRLNLVGSALAHYELVLKASEFDDHLQLVFEYNGGLFSDETIMGLIHRLNDVIRAVVRNPAQKIGAIPVLPPMVQLPVRNDPYTIRKAYPKDRSILELLGLPVRRKEIKAARHILPVRHKAWYRLSSAQKRLYFLYVFDKDSLAYNVPQAIWLKGVIDKDRLLTAFKKLIDRHESFRTSFEWLDGEPVQRISEEVGFELEELQAGPGVIEDVVTRCLRPFRLETAPLIRVALIGVSSKEHLLLVDMHHIITDGVSHGILINDFMRLYQGETLPALPLQYKDYAEWQQSDRQQQKIARQKEFWVHQFAELPEALELPADYPRPLMKGHEGNMINFELGREATSGLRSIGESEGATMFMIVLSVYTILLGKLGNCADVVVGTPVAGRQHADLEGIVGMFVNTLPLRNYPGGDLAYREFLLTLRNNTLACFNNQGYQYEELIDVLKVERDISRNPLFDVLFSYQNFSQPELIIPGLSLELYEKEHSTAMFDLSITVNEAEDRLFFSMEYSTDLFRKETIERFVSYFKKIVDTIVADAGIRIADIDILPDTEKKQLLTDFNDTKADYPSDKTLVGLLEQQVLNNPGNIALIFEDRQMTYMELNTRANQLAHYLIGRGVRRGDVVALCVERSMEMIIGIVGILKTGAAYLPIDPSSPAARIEQILSDRLLLTDGSREDMAGVNLNDPVIGLGPGHNPGVPILPVDLAYIMYTSGSTGTPKGVMIMHHSVINLIYDRSRVFGLDASDRVLQFATISFDASVEQIWLALLNGAGLVLIRKEVLLDNRLFNEYIGRHCVTHFDTTPAFLENLELASGNSLKRIAAGGENCTARLAKRFLIEYEFHNEYGPTEATVDAINYKVPKDWTGDRNVPIGRPQSNTRAYVLDNYRHLVGTGVKGELYIAGVGLAVGYWNDEATTREKFVDDPFVPGERMYRTGDWARWLSDGTMEYLGRVDDQVKIRGFRIELGEIENRLTSHASISKSIVMVLGEGGNKYLVGYYVSKQVIAPASLRKYLLEQLPDYMVPAYYIRLDQIPLTVNGKINKKVLPLPDRVQGEEYVAPVGMIEERLVEIWSEVLTLDRGLIGTNSSFFELGGHSLNATLLANRIYKVLGVEVPLREIFRYPQLSSLGQYIRSAEAGAYLAIPPAPVREYYTLSSAQKRLYFLYNFDRSSVAYNMPQGVWLTGALDKGRLKAAFRALTDRHESLRTSFGWIGDEPMQRIVDKVELQLEEFGAGPEGVEAVVTGFVRPFRLEAGPLIRVGIVDIGPEKHLLLVDLHHIITDGLSQEVLIGDLISLYSGKPLSVLPLQYKDYAEWQQSGKQQQALARQKEFWIGQFEELPEALDLPTDHPRPLIKDHAGGSVSFTIDAEQTRRLRSMAQAEGTTMFMVLFSVYSILLGKLGNCADVVVGTPVAGRQHADLEGIVGMFVNTLPLRSYPRGDLSYREFLSAVRNNTLACFDNQGYQYEELIDVLKVQRDMSRNPLFDVLFSFQNFGGSELVLPGLSLSVFGDVKSVAKFDLVLTAGESEEQLFLDIEYSTGLFRVETIERFVTYFKKILDAIPADAGIRISDIDILPEAERRELLYDFNDTVADYPVDKTLVGLLEQQVRETPDHIALIFDGQQLSYSELNGAANQLAHYLIGRGVRRGDVVALSVDRSMEMIIAIVGILKIGAAYLPVDPSLPSARIGQMVSDSLLLTDVDLHDPAVGLQSMDDPGIKLLPTDLAYIIYTSGSTGVPKGVMIRHRSVVNYIHAQREAFGMDVSDRVLQFATISFDASVEQIWLALLSGAGLVLIDKETLLDGALFDRYLSAQGVTHLHATPSYLEGVLLERPNSLRRVVAAGEPCPPGLAQRFCERYAFYNKYGPTEATISVTMHRVSESDTKRIRIPIGQPLNNTRVYILDESRRLVAAGVTGELYISGVGLALGYWKDEGATHEKFVADPFISGERIYRTGDLACWLPDGGIDYLGRLDDQVKIRGFRIELGEIEARLRAYDQLHKAVVVVREQGGDPYLVGYYESEQELEVAALKDFLAEQLPEYMVPVYYVRMEQLPVTTSGKLNRKLLPSPSLAERQEYIAPVGRIEQRLVEIWSEVLKLDRGLIGTNSSFFGLGGHSLNATLVTNRIYKALGVEVPLRELFRSPRISSLGQYIRSAEAGAYLAITPVPVREYYALSSAQKRLYFLYNFDQRSLAYNMPHGIWLKGALDKGRLQTAFRALVDRHESLRTSFVWVKDEPMQKIGDKVDLELEKLEMGPEGVEEVVAGFVRPFRLDAGPLIRIGIVDIGPEEHLLLVDMHHIVTDGVSQEILIDDLKSLYGGKSLSGLPLQYKDYAEWQQNSRQQLAIGRQKEFWLGQFEELPEALELPADCLRPLIKDHRGNTMSFTLSREDTGRLYSIAEEKGATMFMVVLSIYTILLGKLGNCADVVVGTPVAGRQHADLEGIVGMFVNTLPLRNYPRGELSYREFLSAIRNNTLACFDNQAYQYEELIDVLKVERDISRNPLFDVLFSYQNFGTSPLELPGLTLTPFSDTHTIAQFDLTLTAGESDGRLFLEIEYSTGLFRAETIERFITYFKKIVTTVLADDSIRIADIVILPDSEREWLLHDLNDTYAAYPSDKSLVDLLEKQVSETPDHIALLFQDRQLTYGEMNARVNQLAHYLMSRGVRQGDVVALCVERSMEMIIALIGILKTGAAYLPVDPSLPAARIGQIVANRLLLRDADLRDPAIALGSGDNPGVPVLPGDLAYIIYTSGSAGVPKGVMIRHRSVINLIDDRSRVFGLAASDRVLQFSTISFDASVEQIWLALLNGAGLVLIGKETLLDNRLFNEYIARHQVTHLDTTPAFLENLDLHPGNSLQRIIAGGESCTAQLAGRYSDRYDLYNEYGPTETTIVSINHRVPKGWKGDKSVPIGRPVSNTRVYVLDQYRRLTATGVKGELYIAGEGLAIGYWKDEATTCEKFVEDPFWPGERMYRTGDLARWLPDGTIEYLGRIDDQVKIRGFRIELGEIENKLTGHTSISKSIVLVRGEGGNRSLVAYYVSGEVIEPGRLRKYLLEQLPDYMVPSYYVRLEEIPLTTNGKIDKKALPVPELVKGMEYVAPVGAIEQGLVEIWSGILKLDPALIGSGSSWFELGGHSLNATVLANRIYKLFGVEVPLKEIFRFPQIGSLGKYIGAANAGVYETIPPAQMKTHYRLSSAQKRIYFLYNFDRNSVAYNMPDGLWIKGALDKDRLKRAFKALIGRHESLRTSFEWVGDEPLQRIGDGVDLELEELRAAPEEVEDVVARFVRPFRLELAPLIRVAMFEVGPQEHLLLVDMHHIITDGVSHGILINDFMRLYREEALPALPLQYKDYAEWQQSDTQRQVMSRQKDFWVGQFEELPEALELPADHPRPVVKSYTAGAVGFTIDAEQTKKLRLIAETQGATMFMTLLSIYTILLGKVSNQEDVVVGTPVAGRQHADLEGIVGMFVNTLPLRNYPVGDLSYREFLSMVRNNTLAGFDNQGYQYEELIDLLKVERDISRSPLFDVLFAYQNFDESELELPGLALRPLTDTRSITKFDLTLTASEAGDGIFLKIRYATALFNEVTVQRFAAYFQKIVDAIVIDAGTRIADIDILPDGERRQLLHDFNDTRADYPGDKTLVALWEQQVMETPDNIALLFNGQQLSYRELNENANRLANYLKGKGVEKGMVVGLLIERSMPMIIGILGILKAGATYLPLDTLQPETRLGQILEDSNTRYIVTEGAFRDIYSRYGVTIDIHHPEIETCADKDPESLLLPMDIAYIIYTSGSTGTPKGVMIQHRPVVNYIHAQKEAFEMEESDRVLQFSTISFDASVEQVWLALLSGAALVLISKEVLLDGLLFDNYLSDHRVTHLHATPSYLDGILLERPNSLKRIVAAGEPCPPKMAQRFCEQYRFYNKYGPTEATVSVAMNLVTDNDTKSARVPIGWPLNNTSIYILGRKGELLPPGTNGELYIGGHGLAKGYCNREELTSQKFVANPFLPGERMYRTGDMARWLPDGTIDYLGRIDDQVKIRGFRIELGEIEVQLSRFDQLRKSVVVVKEQGDDKYLVAYYESEQEVEIGLLKNFLSEKLPEYMVPAYYVRMERLPVTTSGKLNRKLLPSPLLGERGEYIAPVGIIEERLVEIWSDVLKLDRGLIGTNSSFFQLGGHSLKATLLANRIYKALGVEVPLKEIFRYPQIGSLAKYIGAAKAGAYLAIPPAPVREYYPLSSAQKRLHFLYDLHRSSVAYNMPQGLWLEGTLDKGRLQTAFRALVHRHESLRTSFGWIADEPMQSIGDKVDLEFEQLEMGPEGVEAVVAGFVRPFRLEAGPLIRIGIVDIGPEKHLLLVDMHHIITDGVSHGILINDFMQLYKGASLSALPLQYKDYAEWQQSDRQRQTLVRQKEFWLRQFEELPEALELPADYPRPLVKRHEGGEINFTIDAEQTRGLRSMAEDEGATMFMVLLSVYTILLGKLGNCTDVVVGTPVAGRQHADLEGIVGMFVNTVPLRNYTPGDLPYRKFLSVVRNNTLACFDNQGYQYEELIDVLKVRRDISRNPLFDVLFSYQNFGRSEELELPGLKLSAFTDTRSVSKFDLTLTAGESGNELFLNMRYSTALFRAETIERFATYFRKIVEVIVADADTRIADIDVLPVMEKREPSTNRLLHTIARGGANGVGEEKIYAAPSDKIEEQLTEIWSGLLRLDKRAIGVDSSFFELGGHSLKATVLISRIRKEMQIDLPVITIFQSPTIRMLSTTIRQKTARVLQDESLPVLLGQGNASGQDNIAEQHLFFVHDGSGDIQGYIELAGLIPGHTCWGLRSSTLGSFSPKELTLAGLAKEYLQQVRAVQPSGPYRLAGWSFGGLVATEMVRQLEAVGEDVAVLLMIDTRFPVPSANEPGGFVLSDEKESLFQLLGARPLELKNAAGIDELWTKAVDFFKRTGVGIETIRRLIPDSLRRLIPHFDSQDIDQLMVYANTVRSLRKAAGTQSAAAKVKAPLVYIKAADSHFNLEFLRDHFTGEILITEVSGDHFSIIKIPHVYELSAVVTTALNKVSKINSI